MSAMPYVSDIDVLNEVPESLKRLLRYIARAFYSIGHAILIDTLIHHACVKEEDLLDHLKFERRQLRALINTLKSDKFIKSRMIVETDSEDKTTKHNYYFINYSTFVNVIKYKLDHMRRKIEVEERDNTSRASFKCPECNKAFTDLQVDRLIDPFTGDLLCDYCQTEVVEEAGAVTTKDSRTMMVKFNEQVEPLYVLLREVEDIKLSQEILKPEPMELNVANRDRQTNRGPAGERGQWSGDATKGRNYFGGNNEVAVSITDDATAADAEAAKKAAIKDRPVWMTESTIGDVTINDTLPTLPPPPSLDSRLTSQDDDIMRTLLVHEKKPTNQRFSGIAHAPDGGSDTDTSSSDSDDDRSAAKAIMDPMLQGFETYQPPPKPSKPVEEIISEEEEEEPMLVIGNRKVLYQEVTESMIAKMTPKEKEAYINMGKELYEDMYD